MRKLKSLLSDFFAFKGIGILIKGKTSLIADFEFVKFSRGEDFSAPITGTGLIRFPSDKIAPINLRSFSPDGNAVGVATLLPALSPLTVDAAVDMLPREFKDRTELSRL